MIADFLLFLLLIIIIGSLLAF